MKQHYQLGYSVSHTFPSHRTFTAYNNIRKSQTWKEKILANLHNSMINRCRHTTLILSPGNIPVFISLHSLISLTLGPGKGDEEDGNTGEVLHIDDVIKCVRKRVLSYLKS